MSDKPSTSTVAKIVGLVATAAAAWAANQLVTQAWKATRGHKPPAADDDGGPLAEIIAAAAVTGAVVAVARVLATRGTAKYAVRAKRDPSLPDISE
jgi:hypothetical protein